MTEDNELSLLTDGEPEARGGSVEVPVDLGLLEETPEEAPSEAYELPDLEAIAEIERETAEQVATVRNEQSLRIANMAQDGVHHFLVNVEGAELCGSCGTPFPCEKWTGEIDPRNESESSGHLVADEDKARAVAELLSIPIEQARQVVLMSTPLDKIGG